MPFPILHQSLGVALFHLLKWLTYNLLQNYHRAISLLFHASLLKQLPYSSSKNLDNLLGDHILLEMQPEDRPKQTLQLLDSYLPITHQYLHHLQDFRPLIS